MGMPEFSFGASYFNGCPTPFEEFVHMCQDLGMNHIEIQLEPPYTPPDISQEMKSLIMDTLNSSSLLPTVHAPYDDINIASFKERIRRASIEIIKDCIDLSADIGASMIVMHGGSCSVHQLSRFPDAIQRFRASLLELAMYAHDMSVRIGLENKQAGDNREIILYPDEHFEVVQEYADFGVGAVVDIGHANTAGIDLPKYLTQMKDYLLEVHLHDNDGSSDAHLQLGLGTVEVGSIMRALDRIKYSGPIIFELDTREQLSESLSYIGSKGWEKQ